MAKVTNFRINKYQILTDSDPVLLARQVNDAMTLGLVPLGGVAVALSESDDFRYVVYAQAIISMEVEPTQPATTTEPQLDWDKAKSHFDKIKQRYEDLMYTPGVNTSLALAIVFTPLQQRFETGERTAALYDEMMSVE